METKVRLKKYAGPIDWNVGGLFTHDWFYLRLFDVCTNFLKMQLPIKYVFGGLHCKFHGGRSASARLSEAEIQKILTLYTKYHVGCRLTFSNFHITSNDLSDPVGNMLLEQLNEHEGNGVIVSSDILSDYIRKKFPKLQLISSLLKPTFETKLGKTDTPEYYNALLQRYNVVVLNTNRAFDDSFLGSLSCLDRIELIANHTCVQNCPNSRIHYLLLHEMDTLESQRNDANALSALEKKRADLAKLLYICDKMHASQLMNHERLFADDINRLIGKGVRHFKLEGRELGTMTITREVGTWIFDPDSPYLSLLRGIIGDTKLQGAKSQAWVSHEL